MNDTAMARCPTCGDPILSDSNGAYEGRECITPGDEDCLLHADRRALARLRKAAQEVVDADLARVGRLAHRTTLRLDLALGRLALAILRSPEPADAGGREGA